MPPGMEFTLSEQILDIRYHEYWLELPETICIFIYYRVQYASMFSINTVGKISHLLVVILLSLASISINFHLPVPKKRLVNPYVQISQERILGQKDLSLNNRWPNSWVNSIFKQNILLNLAYLRNLVTPGEIDWQQVERPFTYEFRLNPKQTF